MSSTIIVYTFLYMEFSTFTITKDDHDRRIDRIARRFLPELPLSAIYSLLRKGLIRLDGKKVSPEHHVREGSSLGIAPKLLEKVRIEKKTTFTGAIPEFLLETDDLLFINKPLGIPVHGINGLDRIIPQTLASSQSLSFRTGPLHRLDKDTTGILVFSRSLEGARWFSEGMRTHTFKKYYIGIIIGSLTVNAEWNDKIDGKNTVITHAEPLALTKNGQECFTLVRFRIITGKKHQIRRQSALRATPLLGDEKYGNKINDTYYLHAHQILFPEQRLMNIPEKITAELPERFKMKVKHLFGDDALAQIGQRELY